MKPEAKRSYNEQPRFDRGYFYFNQHAKNTMSHNFYIDGTLQLDQAMDEIDTKFWDGVLKAAIYNPKVALEHGTEAAIKEYKGNEVSLDEDYLEDGDEFTTSEDSETEDCDEEEIVVPTLTLGMDIQLSGGYFLDTYIADANKVVYQAGVEKGIKVCLKIAQTDLERGPDDEDTMKWAEMVRKFGQGI